MAATGWNPSKTGLDTQTAMPLKCPDVTNSLQSLTRAGSIVYHFEQYQPCVYVFQDGFWFDAAFFKHCFQG